jgi:hypothetical protein
MSEIYKPGWQAHEYHRLSRTQRTAIASEVDRQFSQQTGIGRRLDPTSAKDLELRRTWLRIRDSVMNKREDEINAEIEDMRRDSLLPEIPHEMAWMGWKEAAELLETWFERPPAIAPSYSAPVTTVITMDWVLQFARAKLVYDRMLKERIWTNEASQKRIGELLKQKSSVAGQRWGDLSKPVTEVDKEWINARPVASGMTFDAMTGALGAFELQVAIAGTVVSIGGGEAQVSIEEVGVYVIDSFDFNGSQFLGFWGYRDDPISNDDFRQWRTDNKAGGDFQVFSDIKRTRLTPPDLVKAKM